MLVVCSPECFWRAPVGLKGGTPSAAMSAICLHYVEVGLDTRGGVQSDVKDARLPPVELTGRLAEPTPEVRRG